VTPFSKYLLETFSKETVKNFLVFHRDNPNVYDLFEELALEMLNTGRKRYSARAIIETMRWHHDLKTRSSDTRFKFSDHHYPIYVRLLVARRPEFDGFFIMRK
jgi:hypothetical protein